MAVYTTSDMISMSHSRFPRVSGLRMGSTLSVSPRTSMWVTRYHRLGTSRAPPATELLRRRFALLALWRRGELRRWADGLSYWAPLGGPKAAWLGCCCEIQALISDSLSRPCFLLWSGRGEAGGGSRGGVDRATRRSGGEGE